MPKRATLTRSTAAAKSSRQPHGRKPVSKPALVVADELDGNDDEAVEIAPAARGATTVKISNGLAAAVVGLKERQLTNLRTQGCPVPDGGVRTVEQIAAIVRWRMDQAVADVTRKTDAVLDELGVDSPEAEELRSRRLDNRLKEFKVGTAYGELLEKPRYLHNLSLCLVEINAQMQMVGSRNREQLAACSEPFGCQQIVDDAVNEILGELTLERALHPPGEMIGDIEDTGDGDPANFADDDEDDGGDDDDD